MKERCMSAMQSIKVELILEVPGSELSQTIRLETKLYEAHPSVKK